MRSRGQSVPMADGCGAMSAIGKDDPGPKPSLYLSKVSIGHARTGTSAAAAFVGDADHGVPAGTSRLRPDDQPPLRALHPRHVLRQQHGGRAHAMALRLSAGRRGPTLAQRPGGVEQTLAHADNADVGAPETLERSIVGALTLRDRLVLRADARHAEELVRALGLPVREVIIAAAGGGTDVAVRVA